MKLYGKFDGSAITDISCNLKAFEEYDDIYYTTKEAVSMFTYLLKKIQTQIGFLIIVPSQKMKYFSKTVNTIMKDMSLIIIQRKANEHLNIKKVSQ